MNWPLPYPALRSSWLLRELWDEILVPETSSCPHFPDDCRLVLPLCPFYMLGPSPSTITAGSRKWERNGNGTKSDLQLHPLLITPQTKPYLVRICKGPLGLESWENLSLVPLSRPISLPHPHQSQPFCFYFPTQVPGHFQSRLLKRHFT